MSANRPFTQLNGKQIRKDFPKTFKSIKNWMERCGEVEGNVITEEIMMAFFWGNARFLYDYFDDMNISISIKCSWGYIPIVYTAEVQAKSFESLTRKEAEEIVFNEALTIQEAKL